MFALVRDRPEFSTSTTDLRIFDRKGRLVDAQVTWVRYTLPGPTPQCGYLVQPDAPVRMPLDGPMLPTEWTAEINYLANSDGSMTFALSDGDETRVPVQPGLEPRLRPTVRRRRRRRRARQHLGTVGVPGVGTRRLRGAALAKWARSRVRFVPATAILSP